MKKRLLIILVLVITLLLFAIYYNYNKKEKDNNVINSNYIIHYYESIYLYNIETNNKEIVVEKNEIEICDDTPCNPTKIDSFKIEYKSEYTNFFEKLFTNSDKKELTITPKDLTPDEIIMISEIIKEDIKSNEKQPYEIIESYEGNNKYITRGYYLENDDNQKSVITICMGEQNTGGYRISITEVSISEDEIIIYVQETYPSKNESLTDALTYPYVQIIIDDLPSNILIKNIDTNEQFDIIEN